MRVSQRLHRHPCVQHVCVTYMNDNDRDNRGELEAIIKACFRLALASLRELIHVLHKER